jgi:hypothetical protein
MVLPLEARYPGEPRKGLQEAFVRPCAQQWYLLLPLCSAGLEPVSSRALGKASTIEL